MNVLLADDDRMVLDTLQRYIEFRGDHCVSAQNGQEALDALNAAVFDLVITDIQMPKASGFDVLQLASSRDVPVIIITGFADMDRAVQAVNEGAFAFLPKPVMFADLNERMNAAWSALQARRNTQRELETLQQTTAEQQQRLAQARALSVSILNAVPFPVCVIDRQRRIHLANPAFVRQFAPDAEVVEGTLLEDVAPRFHFSVASDALFDVFHDPKDDTGVTVPFGDPDVEDDAHFFHVTGFGLALIDLARADIDQPLTCLFMRDVTSLVRREEEAAARQWHLNAVSNFRELTHTLVSSADFPDQVVAHLTDLVTHFQPARVELDYKGRIYASGDLGGSEQPYWACPLRIGDRDLGRIALFAERPRHRLRQCELLDDLIEILTRRVAAHEFQMGVVQSERLRSLGEMAAGVAHELNQPLTGIRTFAEGVIYGLRNDWNLPPEQLMETLNDIVGQVDRASEIITYMRNFVRPSEDETLEPFSLAEVIQNALKLVGAQLKAHGIMLHLDVPEGLPFCLGRSRQIEQVLLNLVTNARHALDARMARRQDRPANAAWRPAVSLSADAMQDTVRVAVSDTGGGIPEHLVDRIFEPFFTSKDVGEGTGLGLSISRNIAQAHGGDLYAANRPGIGATFFLILPCVSGDSKRG